MNILFRFILVFAFVFTPAYVMADGGSAGIPKDLMWFSKNPFYAGETINVYTIIYNSTPYQFAGVVELRDGNEVLGRRDFIVGPSGASDVVEIPWQVSLGEHNLGMYVTSGIFTFAGKTVSDAVLTHAQSGSVEIFAERPPAVAAKLPVTASSGAPAASSSLVSSIGIKVTEHLPSPIVSNAVPVLGYLEKFRVSQAASAASVIHGAEDAIIAAEGTSTEKISTSTTPYLDKWGGVIDPLTEGTSTVKTRSQMKGWDLILHGTSGADIVRTPFQYVKLFFTLIFSFITAHALLFYVILFLLIYKIIRIVLGIFF